MSELKSHRIIGLNEECARVDNDYYLKSEVDEVIAELIEKNKRLAHLDIIMASETIKDLEESHKKEVEQLLIEIADKDAEIARLKDRYLDVKAAAHVLKAFKFYRCQLTHCAYDERTAQWIIDNWEQDYKRVEEVK